MEREQVLTLYSSFSKTLLPCINYLLQGCIVYVEKQVWGNVTCLLTSYLPHGPRTGWIVLVDLNKNDVFCFVWTKLSEGIEVTLVAGIEQSHLFILFVTLALFFRCQVKIQLWKKKEKKKPILLLHQCQISTAATTATGELSPPEPRRSLRFVGLAIGHHYLLNVAFMYVAVNCYKF